MKRTKQRKLLAILLAIIMVMMTMLPTVVFAEGNELTAGENLELKNLYVGGVALIENGNLTSNTIQGVSYLDKTLYLENAEISGSYSFEATPDKIKTAAIYADGPLTLSLSGNNLIGSSSDAGLNFSVYSTEELTLTGTGNLSVSGVSTAFSAKAIFVENTGKLDINSSSEGLNAREGNISLQNSSVTILTTATSWGTAITTASGNFSMKSGSLTIDMPRGNSGYYTYGLYINGEVTISGGTADIEAQQDSIYCKGDCTIISGSITVPNGIRAQSGGTLTIKNGAVAVGGRGLEGINGVYLLGGNILFSGNKVFSNNVIFVDDINLELGESTERLNLEGAAFVLNKLSNISYQLWCIKDSYEDASKRIAFIDSVPTEGQISFFTGKSGKNTYVPGCTADMRGGSIPVDAQITVKNFSSPTKAGYIFGGWYDNESFTGEAVTTPEAGKTYYAKWTKKSDQSISYGNDEVAKHINDDAFTNELTKTTVDGAITYTSSNPAVATVNETTGEVTIVGAGSATITAIAAETDTHKEAIAAYTLTVTDHNFTNYVSNKDATCTEDGTKTAACDHGCGETDTIEDAGSAKGHSFGEWEIVNSPTCTTDGSKSIHCKNCDVTKDSTIIPATGTGGDNDRPSKPDTDAPQTGDNRNMILWIALLVVSAAGIGTTLVIFKKRGAHAKTR